MDVIKFRYKNLCYFRLNFFQILLSYVVLAASWSVTAQTPLTVLSTASSSRQADYLGDQNLVSNDGFTVDPQNPSSLLLASSALAYTSSYGTPNDETPLVHFDFGSKQNVDRFRVWNGNEPGYVFRGFRSVTIQYSDDGQRWTTIPERFVFERAPGTNDYAGQSIGLPRPISARFVRFVCNSTWRQGGNSDIASLSRVKFYTGGEPTPAPEETLPFPLASGVVNVKMPPYNAKGDGMTDDTDALQRAIIDNEGTRRTIFLPNGTYSISKPLSFSASTSTNRVGFYGNNTLRGEKMATTVIRLKDKTLTQTVNAQAVLSTGYTSFVQNGREETTADWFNNNVSELTIDIGRGNPGAKGMEFFSNNTGSVRNVRIISQDGLGAIGLDLGHLDKNGPLLVKGLTVRGFGIGVRTGFTVNSQTFENLRLTGQSQVAFENNGQSISVKGLTTRGQVPALLNRYGFAALIDATLEGIGNAGSNSAITNGEYLFAHDVRSSGFARTIENTYGAGLNVEGPILGDYVSSGSALKLFSGADNSLNLRMPDTPELKDGPVAAWANVRDFRLTTEDDDAPAFQRAIDSGARDIYLPTDARIVLKADVIVRGAVSFIHGMQSSITVTNGAKVRVVNDLKTQLVALNQFVVQGSEAPVIVNESTKKLVVLDSAAGVRGTSTGAIFLENVVGRFEFGKHYTWARQLNSEPSGLKITNAGGRLSILGLKTERAGTVVATTQGGATEILGGLIYTTTAGNDPMFSLDNGYLGVSVAEIAYNTPPYATLVTETRQGITRVLQRGQAPLRFSFLGGSAIPLFVSRP